MALFDNVTYTHYHDDLGRSVVPDAATFDAGKLEIILYVKSLVNDGLIVEREPGGIDNACCMMMRVIIKQHRPQQAKATRAALWPRKISARIRTHAARKRPKLP